MTASGVDQQPARAKLGGDAPADRAVTPGVRNQQCHALAETVMRVLVVIAAVLVAATGGVSLLLVNPPWLRFLVG